MRGIAVASSRARRAGGVTAETAILLADVLDTTPEFWMNLQVASDPWHARPAIKKAG